MRFGRVLVANRGEIAIRIMRACRELGIESVAIFSDADADATHVSAADLSVRIGPASPAESYLSIPAVIEAARSTGADAVHPGYGFLSENPAFARACDGAGCVFIGPPADVIERMGSKIAARALMIAAGVPVVPGVTPRDQSDAGVAAAAREIGYPVVVKASAGGGGKGMRVLGNAGSGLEMIPAARREAMTAFGDGTLYVERLIERPRHVEIQVFCDNHGNVVHLFERECSIQRRHQKVVEESPSPALTPALRDAMGRAAVAAARAAQYRNAGTIEFLLEGAGDEATFYFLEMNTRLQVEHPVTEAVTGVDIVHAQLTVAAGGALPWTQDALAQRGHAIEVRVYAEDSAHGFLPQAGTLSLYREPQGPGIRIDSGVREGASVPVNYDPLLAKLTVFAETRSTAIDRALAALRDFPVLGIRTNIPFLGRVLNHAEFRAGHLHTGFIEQHRDALQIGGAVPDEAIAAATTGDPATARPGGPASTRLDPWATLRGWGRSGAMATRTLILRSGDHEYRASVAEARLDSSNEASLVSINEQAAIATRVVGPGEVRIGSGPERRAWVSTSGDTRWVFLDGEVFELEVLREGRRRTTGDARGSLSAPMPATVVRVDAAPGDRVRKGDSLIILEAMKMELPVRAPADGIVASVHCKTGDLVKAGAPLVELEQGG